jgi:hypothetical protein
MSFLFFLSGKTCLYSDAASSYSLPFPSPLSPLPPIQQRAALHHDKEVEYTDGNISLD